MHCAKCGYNNITSARVCAKCGAPLVPAPKRPARTRGERKTVQLPSYGAAHEKAQRSKPQTREENERPWEARIPSRDRRTSQAEEYAARDEEQAMQREERVVRRDNRVERRDERVIRREEQTTRSAENEQAPDEQARTERVQAERVEQETPIEHTQVVKEQAEKTQGNQLEIGQIEIAEEAEQAEEENLQKYRGRFATHVPTKKRSQPSNEASNTAGRAATAVTAATGSLASEAGSIKTASKRETSSQVIEDAPRPDTSETHPASSSQRAQESTSDTEVIRKGTSTESLHPRTEPSQPKNNEQDAQQGKSKQQATEQITEKISVESMQGKDDIPDASKAATIVIPATAATAGATADATVKMTALKSEADRQIASSSAPKRAANNTNATQSDSPTIVVNRTSPTQRHAPKKEKNTGKKAIGVVAAIALLACLGIGGWYFTHGSSPKSTVSFDTNGGSSISQQYIPENGQLQQPMSPTREGYKFEGWYLDASYNEPAKFPLTITKDTTLYAKWVPESQNGVSTSASTSSSSSSSVTSNLGDSSVSGVVSGGGSSGGATASGGSSGGGYASGGSGSGEGGSDSGSGGGTGGGAASDTGDVTTSVSVIAADGATLSGEVHLHNGYVIPDSSERVYSLDELRALNLSDADLCIAWNEPFARLGHDFDNPGLQNYFDNRSWYSNSFRKVSLQPSSPAEINVSRLQELARENASSAAWLNLRTY